MEDTLRHIVGTAGTAVAGLLFALFLAYLLAAVMYPFWIDKGGKR